MPMKMGEIPFVVAVAHLVDRMSSADPEPRLEDIRKVMDVIHGYEAKASISKTIVMGDLNANPYDKELHLPNAVICVE